MNQRTLDMTQGKPISLITSFALPLMLGNVFQQFYTVVDTAVVGKALGVGVLAAMGSTDWIGWMMVSFIQGLTQGFGILMAQRFGARDEEGLRKTVGASVVLSAIGAVVLLIAGQLAAAPVLRLLHTPEEIIHYGVQYLRYIFAGVPISMAYNLLACTLRSLGDGKTPLHAMMVASCVNVALDLLFVLVLHWGIPGAAIATLIAQACSVVFCLMRIRRLPVLKLKKGDFRLSGLLAWRLLRLGFPVAMQNAIISIGGMIVQTVVNGFGVAFIAGFTATNKLYGVLEIAATSYGYAMTTYAGQNLGAGNIPRIRQGIRAASGVCLVISAVIAGIMIAFGRLIVGLFISGTPEETKAAIDVAYKYLTIMAACLPTLYLLYVFRSTIQGVGNTVLPMVSGIAEFIMRICAALLLPLAVGEIGLYYAEVLAWIGADFILIPSYFIVLKQRERRFAYEKRIDP